MKADKEKMINLIPETVQSGGSVFSEPDSVVNKLAGDVIHPEDFC